MTRLVLGGESHGGDKVRCRILVCLLLALPGVGWTQDGSAIPPTDFPADPDLDAIATPVVASKQPGSSGSLFLRTRSDFFCWKARSAMARSKGREIRACPIFAATLTR